MIHKDFMNKNWLIKRQMSPTITKTAMWCAVKLFGVAPNRAGRSKLCKLIWSRRSLATPNGFTGDVVGICILNFLSISTDKSITEHHIPRCVLEWWQKAIKPLEINVHAIIPVACKTNAFKLNVVTWFFWLRMFEIR